jgi:phosphoglycolate phosphatase
VSRRAALFDLDGTLTDPRPGITQCLAHALTALGRRAPALDDLACFIGPPLRGTFARLLDTEDEALLDRAIALYRERFGTVGLFENAVYPGIPAAVAAVRAAGVHTFVATSKPHVYARQIVAHFRLAPLFDAVYGSELDGTRVDKAELIAHALREQKLEPARVVMIGDREHDLIAALACGVRAIGVTYGYGSEAELSRHGPTALAQAPDALPALVAAVLGDG